MALNLNDPGAIDYSSEVPYFPFDVFGDFDFMILDYKESGAAGSEENKSDKEFDVSTVEVLASSNPAVKVGDKLVFWFQTGGDGVNQKNRKFKAAELRQFVSAATGVHPTSTEYKKYDAAAARKTLCERDFSAVETGVSLKASRGNETKKSADARKEHDARLALLPPEQRPAAPAPPPAAYFTEKAWSPLKA